MSCWTTCAGAARCIRDETAGSFILTRYDDIRPLVSDRTLWRDPLRAEEAATIATPVRRAGSGRGAAARRDDQHPDAGRSRPRAHPPAAGAGALRARRQVPARGRAHRRRDAGPDRRVGAVRPDDDASACRSRSTSSPPSWASTAAGWSSSARWSEGVIQGAQPVPHRRGRRWRWRAAARRSTTTSTRPDRRRRRADPRTT